MSNIQLSRFSSQILSLLGAQPKATSNNGTPAITLSYGSGISTTYNYSSINQASLGNGVVGSFSSDIYNEVKCYFMSRGANIMYADTMAALLIDMAAMIGINPITLLEVSNINNVLSFSENAYRAMNNLRDQGNQIGSVTDVVNSNSQIRRQIRI